MDFVSRLVELEQFGNILAPPEFWKLPQEKIDSYGCGPGKIGDWLVPDTIWGENIQLA